MKNWTRKEFLRSSLVGGAALAAGSRLYGAAGVSGSANGDIRVAVVGINGQGNSHMKSYFDMPGTRLVALCDVDSEVLGLRVSEAEKANIKVNTYQDYRRLLEDKNIDAVVIATPNHWHSLMTIWALQAGKDIYVEKPLSHNVWEGRQAVEAHRKYNNRIVQAGTQNRSSDDIRLANEYIQSGKLGKIQWARGLCYKERASIGKSAGPQPIPASVDYNLWTGPADMKPPHRSGKRGPIHYDWHWFWNYGGGDMTNQGIHQMDVARWMLGEPGLPPTVMAFGGRFGYDDDAETPNTEVSVFGYEKAPLIFEVRGLPMKAGMRAMDHYRGARVGVVVQCEGGYVQVTESGNATVYDNNNEKLEQFAHGGNARHRTNFIQAVRTRRQPLANGQIEACHYSSALCHLGNISYMLGAQKSNAAIAESIRSNELTKEAFGRMKEHLKANEVDMDQNRAILGPLLTIDTKREIFTGSDRTLVAAANRNPLLKREGRGPFKVPTFKTGIVASS